MSTAPRLTAEALERVLTGLHAADRLDRSTTDPDAAHPTPELVARRAYALAEVTAAATIVRGITDTLDQGTDALAWALHTHGDHSHTQVARALGYGRTGGGRSVSQVQTRLNRERRRRAARAATAMVAAPAGSVRVPDPPEHVDPAAHTAAATAATAAALAEAGHPDPTATTDALETLAKAWGSAAGALLAALEDTARQALASTEQTDMSSDNPSAHQHTPPKGQPR